MTAVYNKLGFTQLISTSKYFYTVSIKTEINTCYRWTSWLHLASI